MSKSWLSHGKRSNMFLPAYAIPDHQLCKTAKKLNQLLDNSWHKLLSELTYSQHDIIESVLMEAGRHMDKVSTVTNVDGVLI